MDGDGEVPSIVHEVLRSPGQPLDPAVRTFMEPRLGRDFSSVRVHTGTKAIDSAHALSARAYTGGSNIVFGQNQFAPETTAGRKLLAHELTHVVQQQGAAGGASRSLRVDAVDSAAEREAEAHSASVVEGRLPPRAALSVRANGVLLQRQSIGGDPGGMDDEGAG